MVIEAPTYVKSYGNGRVELDLISAFKSKKGKRLLSKIANSTIPQIISKLEGDNPSSDK